MVGNAANMILDVATSSVLSEIHLKASHFTLVLTRSYSNNMLTTHANSACKQVVPNDRNACWLFVVCFVIFCLMTDLSFFVEIRK